MFNYSSSIRWIQLVAETGNMEWVRLDQATRFEETGNSTTIHFVDGQSQKYHFKFSEVKGILEDSQA